MSSPMWLEKVTPTKIVFKLRSNRLMGTHFIYDLHNLPAERRRKVVVTRKHGKSLTSYSLPWAKFVRQTAIGSVAYIPWDVFVRKTVNLSLTKTRQRN